MRILRLFCFILSVLPIASDIKPAFAAGFQRLSIPQIGRDTPIETGIWYPVANDQPTEKTIFGDVLAINAPILTGNYPLILISHGHSAWMGSFAPLARFLADRGYIVAAPTHPGNNFRDLSHNTAQWMARRPAHLTRVIAYLQEAPDFENMIATDKIGLFGFSAGGHSVLSLLGGEINLPQLQNYCRQNPEEFACTLPIQTLSDHNFQGPTLPNAKAAFILAPGFGFAFDPGSLKKINQPVQIWSGELDKRVPAQSNGDFLLQYLPENPKSGSILVQNAGHFSFLPPCAPQLKLLKSDIWQMVCVDHPDFDRSAFHQHLNQSVYDFFENIF